jgi:hypothetical protein
MSTISKISRLHKLTALVLLASPFGTMGHRRLFPYGYGMKAKGMGAHR